MCLYLRLLTIPWSSPAGTDRLGYCRSSTAIGYETIMRIVFLPDGQDWPRYIRSIDIVVLSRGSSYKDMSFIVVQTREDCVF